MVLYIVDIISSFLYSWYFINRFSFVYSWYFINRFGFFRFIVNSLVFTCSKWTMKIIQNLWYLFKINNINIKNININININSSSWPYSNVSIIDFEQILDHDLVFLSPTLGKYIPTEMFIEMMILVRWNIEFLYWKLMRQWKRNDLIF